MEGSRLQGVSVTGIPGVRLRAPAAGQRGSGALDRGTVRGEVADVVRRDGGLGGLWGQRRASGGFHNLGRTQTHARPSPAPSPRR